MEKLEFLEAFLKRTCIAKSFLLLGQILMSVKWKTVGVNKDVSTWLAAIIVNVLKDIDTTALQVLVKVRINFQ